MKIIPLSSYILIFLLMSRWVRDLRSSSFFSVYIKRCESTNNKICRSKLCVGQTSSSTKIFNIRSYFYENGEEKNLIVWQTEKEMASESTHTQKFNKFVKSLDKKVWFCHFRGIIRQDKTYYQADLKVPGIFFCIMLGKSLKCYVFVILEQCFPM